MERIGEVGGLFIDGNPGTNTKGTILDAPWLNAVQEELSTLIEGEGIVLTPGTNNQLSLAITRARQLQKNTASVATGTVNVLVGDFATITALTDKLRLAIRASGANTITTPNFTPNTGVVGPKFIVKGNNLPLVAGDIAGAGHILDLQYDLTLDRWVLFNPAKGINVASPAATETVSGLMEISTAAEAVAGTSDTVAITPAKLRAGLNAAGTAPVYACRAWVCFNGTGVVAIISGGNISSITDLGTGLYRLHFTTNMPDALFAVFPAAGVAPYDVPYLQETKTVSSVDIRVGYTSTSAATDIVEISCMIMR